jgi:hypothetical protein
VTACKAARAPEVCAGPLPGRPVRAAVLRYRVMAYETGVMLIILCFVGIALQIAGHPVVANYVGDLHG